MYSLPLEFKKVLSYVSRALSEINVRWVLVGSTASYLNGVKVEPKDIDIIVETDKIYEVDKVFSSNFHVLRRVKYSSSKVYSSHYGIFKALNVKIEVMADLKICGEMGCLKVEFEKLYRYSRVLKMEDVEVRIAPLEWQLVANIIIPKKEKRIVKILETLKIKGVDIDILNDILSSVPPEIKRQTLKLLKQYQVHS